MVVTNHATLLVCLAVVGSMALTTGTTPAMGVGVIIKIFAKIEWKDIC